MPSFFDLLQLPDKASLQSKMFDLLRLAGFPTPSWQRFSILRHFSENEPLLLADLWQTASDVFKGGFIKLAGDGWSDLCAENVFSETRKPAVVTLGVNRFSDPNGAGPFTLTANAIICSTADQKFRYSLTADGTIPAGGYIDLPVQAQSGGSDYNVPNNAINTLVTSVPGVVVSNPPLPNGTWITQNGADIETNAELAARCLAKWGVLGAGTTESAYLYAALSASSEIRKARAYSPYGGQVSVVVGGSTGPVSGVAYTAFVSAIEAMRPLGLPVSKFNSTANSQVVAATLTMASGASRTAAIAQAVANVSAYSNALGMGALVSREKLIGAIVTAAGVTDMAMTLPVADIQLGANEQFVPTVQIA